MTDYELKDIDTEDINDLLVKVERSFNIKFGGTELKHISTFGELFLLIANKIQLDNLDDCTSQQAFYKLRSAISATLQIDKKTISTNFPLVDLLPKHSRRLRTKKLEKALGIDLHILRPPHWVTTTLAILLSVSLVGLFFNWQVGLLGLLISVTGIFLAAKIANELNVQTVGQVAEKMSREHYLKSRRNPNTFNKQEIEKILVDWFSFELDFDKNKLTSDAKLV